MANNNKMDTKFHNIMEALGEMLSELNDNEILQVEDFIVNYCTESEDPNNLFRMLITNP